MLESWTMALPENNTTTLRDLYSTKPITMHKTYPSKKGMKWPRVIREAYAAIWQGNFSRIIIKAPRGGGKSKLLGVAGFDLWYLKHRSVVNMGGSLVQAEVVYDYFTDCCDIHPSINSGILGGERGITMSETCALEGNKFSCVTASPKQVRGKHPDVLLSDETCETSDELIDSATPMVNDSQNPLIVMASTFHKIFGRFAEIWDNAEQRGYHRIQWDIFDVALPFPADYWETGITKDGKRVKDIQGIERLKAHAGGRTGDPDGWVTIEAVVQAWREKPTENWFEVEYLGTRPSAAGLVLKPEDVDRSRYDDDSSSVYNYRQGTTCVLGIDWGFSSMTAVAELMQHLDDVVVLIDNKNYHQDPAEEIIADVVKKVRLHGIRFIYADSAGKFENVALQNALNKEKLPCKVIEVVFSKEKEGMLGNLRAHFEQAKFKMAKRFLDAFYQLKNYRYAPGTDKVVKKDDHIPDAIQCGLQHFKLGQGAHHLARTESAPGAQTKPITRGIVKKKF
jgi:hypothetical protein